MPRYLRVLHRCALLACLLFLVGCDSASMMNRFTKPQDKANVEHYVDLLRQQKFDEIEKSLDGGLDGADASDKMATMAAMIPPQNPLSIKVVGSQTLKGMGFTRSDITLEYEFPGKWLLVNLVTTKREEGTFITGFMVNPIPDSLENLNRFTLSHKGETQYDVLLFSIVMMVFTIYAFVACIKTKIAKRKWLWLIGTLIGICQVSVNWTSGQLHFSLITIHLPPFGATEQLYAPWFIYVYVPIGAILFLVRRKHLSEPVQPITELPTPNQP